MHRIIECPYCKTQQFADICIEKDTKIQSYNKLYYSIFEDSFEPIPSIQTWKLEDFHNTQKNIDHKCINSYCQENFNIPLKSKKIFLSRDFQISDSKYKYAIYVKNNFYGILDFADFLDYEKILKFVPEFAIDFNKKLIEESNIYVGFIMSLSIDVLMEMAYAYHINKPIYIINPTRIYLENSWIKYIALETFEDIDKCYQYIINEVIYECNLEIKRK